MFSLRIGGRLTSRGLRTGRGKKSSEHIVIPPSDSILPMWHLSALRQLRSFKKFVDG
jgi:hypothetical protein